MLGACTREGAARPRVAASNAQEWAVEDCGVGFIHVFPTPHLLGEKKGRIVRTFFEPWFSYFMRIFDSPVQRRPHEHEQWGVT